jgi:uncharacterized spore protein YtfJ
MDVLFSKMQSFITTETVVGEAIHIGGVIIVPLVDVVFGVGAGANEGGEADKNKKEQSGGGMGGKISPSAVLVIVDGNVSLVNIKNQDSLNKLIDLAPGLLAKLNLGSILKKGGKDAKESDKVTVTEEIKVEIPSGESD